MMNVLLQAVVLASVLVLYRISGQDVTPTMTKFKAAVYQHSWLLPPKTQTPLSRQEAVQHMMRNIDVYKNVTSDAKNQGAQIVVFPEDGLFGGGFSRDTLYPFLETIPDPRHVTWSPCDDPDRYPNSIIQVALSCLAKNNDIFVVANMGDVQPCTTKQTESHCPKDGRFQYNTDVAFGPDGILIARYHKINLFYEKQFDVPEIEHIWFDTPFGRVGLMTCFDVLFKEPGVPSVLEHNVTIIAFPTAWMDALPLLPAIGFHSAFARAFGINYLAANIHFPQARFHGGGLYAQDGAQKFYYGGDVDSRPRLVVAELDAMTVPQPNINVGTTYSPAEQVASPDIRSDESKEKQFKSVLFYDTFDFKEVDKPTGNITVCQKKVCCHLSYEMAEGEFGKEMFAFGAYDGPQQGEGTYYLQICTMVKCADRSNRSTCGSVVNTTETAFVKIDITAYAQTPFLFPMLILSDTNGNLSLTEKNAWTFKGNRLWTSNEFHETVLSASLYGRDYSRDEEGLDSDEANTMFQKTLTILFTMGSVLTSLIMILK